MTTKGRIQNGAIVLDESINLPEGTVVVVEIVASSPPSTWAERFKEVIGTVDDLPPNMARNHDHYLHGAPHYDDPLQHV